MSKGESWRKEEQPQRSYQIQNGEQRHQEGDECSQGELDRRAMRHLIHVLSYFFEL